MATKRERIIKKYNGICQICRKKTNTSHYKDYPELDHIVPKSEGGSNDENNMTLLCNDCNNKKSNLFGEKLILKIIQDFEKATGNFNFDLLEFYYKLGVLTDEDIHDLQKRLSSRYEFMLSVFNGICRGGKNG